MFKLRFLISEPNPILTWIPWVATDVKRCTKVWRSTSCQLKPVSVTPPSTPPLGAKSTKVWVSWRKGYNLKFVMLTVFQLKPVSVPPLKNWRRRRSTPPESSDKMSVSVPPLKTTPWKWTTAPPAPARRRKRTPPPLWRSTIPSIGKFHMPNMRKEIFFICYFRYMQIMKTVRNLRNWGSMEIVRPSLSDN